MRAWSWTFYFSKGTLVHWRRKGWSGVAVFLEAASEVFVGGDPRLRDGRREEQTDRGSWASIPHPGFAAKVVGHKS